MIVEKNKMAVPFRVPGTKIRYIEGDVLEIGDRIPREVDPNLELRLNKRLMRYEVWYENKYGRQVLVRVIHPEENLGEWLIHELKYIDSANGRFGWKDLVAAQEKHERDIEKQNAEAWAAAEERIERELANRGLILAPKVSMYRSKKERKAGS
jgi:hypothetical protein